MNHRNKARITTFWLASVMFMPVFADDTTTDLTATGMALYLDQDMFIPGRNEDRDYTMGIGLEWFLNDSEHAFCLLCDASRALTKLVDAKPAKTKRLASSLMLGVTVFTPDDLASSAPIYTDRPYSSLIYLANKEVFSWDSDSVLGTELQLGILGLDLAKNTQTALHQAYRHVRGTDTPVDPKGWHHQISNGGEPTAKFRVNYMKAIPAVGWGSGTDLIDLDLAWKAEANLGYQTNASIGVQGRLGAIHSRFWSTPINPVSRGAYVPIQTYSNELYLWGSADLRLIAYDALLQGQFRDSDVTVRSSEVRRLVGEAAIGVTTSLLNTAQLTFSLNLKTAEIDAPASRTQFWGGTYISWRF